MKLVSLGFLFLWVFVTALYGQGCDGVLYATPGFQVQRTNGIAFGSAKQPTFVNPNATTTLRLDLYEPHGDTRTARPLIVMAFGGAFVVGTRTSPDIVELCNRWTRLGYVCASIDYRLTPTLATQNQAKDFYLAVIKAVHDMKAAIRFFYRDAAGTNLYRIDTQNIFIGGVSAGAITALHAGYIRSEAELPPAILADTAGLGGLEGLSGNPGYSSRAKGIIGLCGALGDTAWVDRDEIPAILLHGDQDDIVPIDKGRPEIALLNIPLDIYGSRAIHQQANRVGVNTTLVVWPGAGHTPFILGNQTGAYTDSAYWATRNWLYQQVCGQVLNRNPEQGRKPPISLAENPASNLTTFHNQGARAMALTLFDGKGQQVTQMVVESSSSYQLNIQNWSAGLYFWEATDLYGHQERYTGRLVVVH